jgi:phage tail-like protein
LDGSVPIDERPGQVSRYLDYLPAIYQQDVEPGRPNFLGRFLLAFEQVLTGLGDVEDPGLEERLDGIVDPVGGQLRLAGIHRYFDPGPYPDERAHEQAPAEFLEWLAGWVALAVRADLDELRRRDFPAQAVSLYRLRGTKEGLERVIRIYTRLESAIDEMDSPFQLGTSRLGVDTDGRSAPMGGGAPHFFRVLLRLPAPDPAARRRQEEIARTIVDMEKPAHTHYRLDVETPAMQVGVHSTIGVDTLLTPTPE